MSDHSRSVHAMPLSGMAASGRSVLRLLPLLVLPVVAGCAAGASSNNMTASLQPALAIKPGTALYQSVGIAAVTGGQDTNPLLMSQVGDGEFKAALKNSLIQSQMHAIAKEKYTVTAQLDALDQPLIGLDMTVTSKVRYKVTRVADKAVVLDKVVTASHTATFGDSAIGVERLRLANEGALKNNIANFMAELAQIRA